MGAFRRLPRWLVAAAAAIVLLLVAPPAIRALPDSAASRSTAFAVSPQVGPASGPWGDFVEPTDALIVVKQPDGSTFKASMTPAELGASLEVEGYSVVKGSDGWWTYASKRGAEGLESSAARVGSDAPPASLRRGIGRTKNVWSDGEGGDIRTQMFRQLQMASRAAQLEAAAAGEPRVFKFPVVMFATWWDEGQSSPQFQDGNDVEHYQDILDGFGGNPTGTLTEFYFENSYGQFLVEVDVLAQPDGSPYASTRSMQDRCYYGGIDPPADMFDDLDPLDTVIGAGGGGALGMAIEAMNTTTLAADHDFSGYDNDGDGSVDFMGIIHSGPEMAVTGNPCHTWSHAISVSTFTSIAGSLLQDFGLPVPDTGFKAGLPIPGQAVTYDRLFTMPEFETPTGVLTIGVATHEMAHALGEPDYYGTNGSSAGSGDWDIMSGGSYGGTPSGSNPTWFNPTSRVFQGWVTPTIVEDSVEDYVLQRRSKQPSADYAVGTANPNLVLVPTKWIDVGDTDELDHTWDEDDVYGLHLDGENGYVIEGYYLEFASRMPQKSDPVHPEMTRESYFDRWLYGSGLLTWHFDYWRRSQVLTESNGGNDIPNRMQMDVEEWDLNDNTQEIALNLNRADPTDVVWDAATGITSGTHRGSPGFVEVDGDPQADIPIPEGPVTAVTPYEFDFVVADNPANLTMTVTAAGVGDCTLQLLYEGDPATELGDSGFVGAEEVHVISSPDPGNWTAVIGDFAACGLASGNIDFTGSSGFDTLGTADTWSNWTKEPTGWAFTNVRTGPKNTAEGLSHASDAGDAAGTLVLDILQLDGETDFSPGHVRAVELENGGRAAIHGGAESEFEVRVFSNGSSGSEDVDVEVYNGPPEDGQLIASGDVSVSGYDSDVFFFEWAPLDEGGFDLYAVVDPNDVHEEAAEDNNIQKSSLWAGSNNEPLVLIVDDDGGTDIERVYAGALAANGIPYDIVERHANAEQMSFYSAVIWVSSLDRMEGQLDEYDREQIGTYLYQGGGNLWLSSNRAIEALYATDNDEFAIDTFGAGWIDIDSFYKPVTFKGTGDILGDGELSLEVMPGRPFVDKYEILTNSDGEASALGVLEDSGTPGDGAILGIKHENLVIEGEGATFRTVVTGFSQAQVSDPQDNIAMTRAIMEWLGVAQDVHSPGTTEPLIYHSQLRQTPSFVDQHVRAIVLGGGGDDPVTLFYRHHGIGDYVAVPMTPSGEQGGYVATIPAAEVTPDGIDYYVKAGSASTYDPRRAVSGTLGHGLAVFMPDAVEPQGTTTTADTTSTTGGADTTPPPSAQPSTDDRQLPATGGDVWLGLAGLVALGIGLFGRRVALRTR